MTKTKIVLLSIVVVAIILTMWVFGSYNTMVVQEEVVDTSWAQVETQYQRRFDLVPNLVNATKGVLTQEQEVFGKIAEARTRYAGSSAGTSERAEAISGYDSAISRLLLVMENYPQLRSVESVRALTDELAGTENRVAVSRNRYNDEVRIMNTMIRRFPGNLVASIFGFEKKELFQSVEGSEQAPNVDLTL